MKNIKPSFVIDILSTFNSSARAGKLITENSVLETPCFILTTKGGSVPHLSKEVLEYVLKDNMIKHILQINLSNTNHMEEALKSTKSGIASFIGYKEMPTILNINDPCDKLPAGFQERDTVPLFTRRGKEVLTVQRYMEIVTVMKPDIYQLLCDADTNMESSKKRIQKSLDRSTMFLRNSVEFLNDCKELSNSMILAPIIGGYDKLARTSSIKSINEYLTSNGGYLLDGFHNNGSSILKINSETLKDIVSHCIKEINNDKIRFMNGAYNPLTILELINLGIDVFDTSYIYLATQNNKALCFDYVVSEVENKNKIFALDMNDEKHKEEFIPFRSDCICLACVKHTRAYVHHLIKTKELLGPILIMIHNLHHFSEFFENIRKTIRNNEYPKLMELLRSQMQDEGADVVSEKAEPEKKARSL